MYVNAFFFIFVLKEGKMWLQNWFATRMAHVSNLVYLLQDKATCQTLVRNCISHLAIAYYDIV